MGIWFGIINGLFPPWPTAVWLAPVGCGVLAGAWKAVSGLSLEQRRARNEMILEGKAMPPLSWTPVLEAVWQCVLAYLGTAVTLVVMHLLD